jgi:membrane associated rhomboid family serine protease
MVVLGILVVVAMIAATLGVLEVGRRFGMIRSARDPEGAKSVAAGVQGAVFGLMGLLIAFTFSGAGTRFDARRARW